MASQLYYDFSREMERIKSNLYNTNATFTKDTQLLNRQVMQLRTMIELRNKEMDKHLAELKRMIYLLATEHTN